MAIGSSLKANVLFSFHQSITNGLLRIRLYYVSYAANGTETEHLVQCLATTSAHSIKKHIFKHPFDGPSRSMPDIVAPIHFLHDPSGELQPFAFPQDSGHARKTLCNGSFSGARALVLGNHLVYYGQYATMVQDLDCPLMKRDVIKLDRQDDLAAIHLFSAAHLEYIWQKHPDWLSAMVYQFVFGELVDASYSMFILGIDR